jgi:hypothetical protein
MRYYLGIDWADEEHRVWIGDPEGHEVAVRRVAHTAEGFADFGRWLDEQRAAGQELWAAIERPDGRLVDFLLDHAVLVYAVNPKALDRARDRYRASHAKDDGFDAFVLGQFLRTDHEQLHALRPNSPGAEELKLLARDYEHWIRQQTRLVHQLTLTLKEYYPRALELFGDLTTQTARDFLRRYPTPEAAAQLRPRQWQAVVRAHRMPAARAAQLWQTLQAPQLPVPGHVVRAKARHMHTLVRELSAVVDAVTEYREAVESFFAALPAAQLTKTLPAGGTGVLVAGIWAELGDARGRWQSGAHLEAQAGLVPVTQASGKQRGVTFRFACNHRLRYGFTQYAFVSVNFCEWARAYYRQQRQRGHSHSRALRALGAKWAKIFFVMWERQVPYQEDHHLATIARQHMRQVA